MERVIIKICMYLKKIGCFPPGQKSVKGLAIFLISIYFILQANVIIVQEWRTFEDRIAAMENLNIFYAFFFAITDYYLFPQNLKTMMAVIIFPHFKYHKILKQPDLERKCNDLIRETRRIWSKTGIILEVCMKCFFVSAYIYPVLGFIRYTLGYGNSNDPSLPFESYFFGGNDDMRLYILMLIIEIIYIYFAFILAMLLYLMTIASVHNVILEMELFHLCLNGFNEHYLKKMSSLGNSTTNEVDEINSNEKPQRTEDKEMLILKILSRDLSAHHQTIYRKVYMLRKGIKFQLCYGNGVICFQLCFAIFCFQKDDLMFKLKYGTLTFLVILLLLIYSESGQRIQRQDERLHKALYECIWYNKPLWFQNNFKIMIARNSIPIRLEVYNIFTLNRNNVTVVLKGVYSYFNFLRHFAGEL